MLRKSAIRLKPSPREGSAPRRKRISPWAVWIYGLPLAAVLAGILHFLGHGPFRPVAQTLSTEAELEREVESLRDENASLQQEIDDLMPGQFGIEKRAREQLGWSKPGEFIVHLPDKR